MKRCAALSLSLCLLTALICSCAAKSEAPLPDEVELYFFYNEPCGSCNGTEEFYEIFAEKMNEHKDKYPFTIYTYNVFGTNMGVYERIADERGIKRENLHMPVLIVAGEAYSGMENIGANIAEAYLTAGEDIFEFKYVYYPSRDAGKPLFSRYKANPKNSTIVYFYRTTCYDCIDIKLFIDELPETINIGGRETALDIIRINTHSGVNNDMARAFFEAYGVEQEKQTVPIVFLADTYLSGYDEIYDSLIDSLERGEGLNFKFPQK